MYFNAFPTVLLGGLILSCGCAAPPTPTASVRGPSTPSPTPASTSPAVAAALPNNAPDALASSKPSGSSSTGSPLADSKSLPGLQEVSNIQVPEDFSSDAVYRGRTLYANYCAPCHGADGVGTRGVTPLVDPRRFRYGSQNRQLLRTILYGIPRSAMGKYGQMSTQQGLDLVAYLRSLQK